MCYNGHLGTMGYAGEVEWEGEIIVALAEFQEECFKHIPVGKLDTLSYKFQPIQEQTLNIIEIIKRIKNGEIVKSDFRPLGIAGYAIHDPGYRKDIIGAYCKFYELVLAKIDVVKLDYFPFIIDKMFDEIQKHLHKIILVLEKENKNSAVNGFVNKKDRAGLATGAPRKHNP
jgi:hypothetical protein